MLGHCHTPCTGAPPGRCPAATAAPAGPRMRYHTVSSPNLARRGDAKSRSPYQRATATDSHAGIPSPVTTQRVVTQTGGPLGRRGRRRKRRGKEAREGERRRQKTERTKRMKEKKQKKKENKQNDKERNKKEGKTEEKRKTEKRRKEEGGKERKKEKKNEKEKEGKEVTNATLFFRGNVEPTRMRWKSDQVHTAALRQRNGMCRNVTVSSLCAI